jgi:hypothetical protein
MGALQVPTQKALSSAVVPVGLTHFSMPELVDLPVDEAHLTSRQQVKLRHESEFCRIRLRIPVYDSAMLSILSFSAWLPLHKLTNFTRIRVCGLKFLSFVCSIDWYDTGVLSREMLEKTQAPCLR